jgi:hypothetical protein
VQPNTAAPPVPHGRPARDAWRELDRDTRRALMRSDRPHPDPTTAVIALGYARTRLATSAFVRTLMLLPVLFAWAAVLIAISLAAGLTEHLFVALFLGLLPVALLHVVWRRRRMLVWHRMESVHAAALWVTERAAPFPVGTAAPGTELLVRYDRAALWRIFGIVAAVALLCTAVTATLDPLLGLVVGGVFGVLTLVAVVRTLTQKPRGRAFVALRADGLELSAPDVRVPWNAFTEIRISRLRGSWLTGGRKRHYVVTFVAADAEAVISRLRPSWARRARTSLKAYGGPLSVADLALDRTAEEMAASASALGGLPVRRFGP